MCVSGWGQRWGAGQTLSRELKVRTDNVVIVFPVPWSLLHFPLPLKENWDPWVLYITCFRFPMSWLMVMIHTCSSSKALLPYSFPPRCTFRSLLIPCKPETCKPGCALPPFTSAVTTAVHFYFLQASLTAAYFELYSSWLLGKSGMFNGALGTVITETQHTQISCVIQNPWYA